MDNPSLSNERDHLNAMQRVRRRYCRRIDYHASPDAQALIEIRRARERPGGAAATNSAVLDAIVREWGVLAGLNNQDLSSPMTPRDPDGVSRRLRAGAYDFGRGLPVWAEAWLTGIKAKQSRSRVLCGAKRHRDGEPCRALSEPGKRRCKYHGGRSTGPRTESGKARALANLRNQPVKGSASRTEPIDP